MRGRCLGDLDIRPIIDFVDRPCRYYRAALEPAGRELSHHRPVRLIRSADYARVGGALDEQQTTLHAATLPKLARTSCATLATPSKLSFRGKRSSASAASRLKSAEVRYAAMVAGS